jgi:hypothetical protein
VIGTGAAAMPEMEEVKQEAERRHVKLVVLPTLHHAGRGSFMVAGETIRLRSKMTPDPN